MSKWIRFLIPILFPGLLPHEAWSPDRCALDGRVVAVLVVAASSVVPVMGRPPNRATPVKGLRRGVAFGRSRRGQAAKVRRAHWALSLSRAAAMEQRAVARAVLRPSWPPPRACSRETLATVSRRHREWLLGCARRRAAGREDQVRRGDLRREGCRHASEAARSGVRSRRRSRTRVRQATGEAGRGRRRVGFFAARASRRLVRRRPPHGARAPSTRETEPHRSSLPHGPTAAGRGRAGRPPGWPPGCGSSVTVRTSCIEEG
jgi:hypothetical protein